MTTLHIYPINPPPQSSSFYLPSFPSCLYIFSTRWLQYPISISLSHPPPFSVSCLLLSPLLANLSIIFGVRVFTKDTHAHEKLSLGRGHVCIILYSDTCQVGVSKGAQFSSRDAQEKREKKETNLSVYVTAAVQTSAVLRAVCVFVTRSDLVRLQLKNVMEKDRGA